MAGLGLYFMQWLLGSSLLLWWMTFWIWMFWFLQISMPQVPRHSFYFFFDTGLVFFPPLCLQAVHAETFAALSPWCNFRALSLSHARTHTHTHSRSPNLDELSHCLLVWQLGWTGPILLFIPPRSLSLPACPTCARCCLVGVAMEARSQKEASHTASCVLFTERQWRKTHNIRKQLCGLFGSTTHDFTSPSLHSAER